MTHTPRAEAPLAGSETEVLRGFLDHHRDTLRWKTEGLDADQLDQRLPPSAMTLGGLLKHMAYVEDWWLNQVFAGRPEPEPWASADWQADNDWEWHTATDHTPDELRALLDETIAVSEAIVTEALAAPEGLDALSVRSSNRQPDQRFSLRWILVHLIEEYARHNGHADLLRESVDGQVGA